LRADRAESVGNRRLRDVSGFPEGRDAICPMARNAGGSARPRPRKKLRSIQRC